MISDSLVMLCLAILYVLHFLKTPFMSPRSYLQVLLAWPCTFLVKLLWIVLFLILTNPRFTILNDYMIDLMLKPAMCLLVITRAKSPSSNWNKKTAHC